jgi:hypothetical protein
MRKSERRAVKVLVIDIGGAHVKIAVEEPLDVLQDEKGQDGDEHDHPPPASYFSTDVVACWA